MNSNVMNTPGPIYSSGESVVEPKNHRKKPHDSTKMPMRYRVFFIIAGLILTFGTVTVAVVLYNHFSGEQSGESTEQSAQINYDPARSNAVSHKVTIRYGDGENSDEIHEDVISGETAIEPDIPTRDGYIFDGWVDDNGNKYSFDQVVDSDKTISASWKVDETPEIKKYVVQFDSNGGSGVAPQIVIEGSTATTPAQPSRAGYEFGGWFVDGKQYDWGPVNSNIRLVAKWTIIPTPEEIQTQPEKIFYSVTFNSNGGSRVSSQTVEKGSTATKPINPTRSGYTFTGWYLDGYRYNFSRSVNNNLTLIARWTQNYVPPAEDPTPTPSPDPTPTFTVSFDTSGGSQIGNQVVSSGEKASRPSDPTRSGYVFGGWFTSSRSEYNFDTKVTGNITLFAQWRPIINYSKTGAAGKWIFINNPEEINSSALLADSLFGKSQFYKTTFSGPAEIYFEHVNNSGSSKIWGVRYGIRFYNADTSRSVVLRVNRCGVSTSNDYNGSEAWNQYYNGGCKIDGASGMGKTITIMPKKSVTLFYCGNQSGSFVSGTSLNSGTCALRGYQIFDGVLNLTATGELTVAAIAFRDYENTFEATYSGLRDEKVYSGEYGRMPEVTNNLTYTINNGTPSGSLPVSWQSQGAGIQTGDSWTTNLRGGAVDLSSTPARAVARPESITSDYIGIAVRLRGGGQAVLGPYPSSYDPRSTVPMVKADSSKGTTHGHAWNWANWAVHYHENITIVNNSSTSKTVSFKLDNLDHTVWVNSYYNGVFRTGKTGGYTIWTVTIPAGQSRTMSAELTQGGMSSESTVKRLSLDN